MGTGALGTPQTLPGTGSPCWGACAMPVLTAEVLGRAGCAAQQGFPHLGVGNCSPRASPSWHGWHSSRRALPGLPQPLLSFQEPGTSLRAVFVFKRAKERACRAWSAIGPGRCPGQDVP